MAGRENMPVNWVTVYDAARFANWLHNGQGNGDTETGSYTITPTFITLTRNANFTVAIPAFNEWHRAAYYDTGSTELLRLSDRVEPADPMRLARRNTEHCQLRQHRGWDHSRGELHGSASASGTFDQGGNVLEWIEDGRQEAHRFGKGSYLYPSMYFDAENSFFHDRPQVEDPNIGFRLVMIPESGSGPLVIAGLLGLASWRRRCAQLEPVREISDSHLPVSAG